MRDPRVLFVLVLLFACSELGSYAQVPVRQEFFFPQLVDGKSADNDEFNSVITLNNPNDDTATGTLAVFSSDGNPMTVRFRDLFGNLIELPQINFTIPAHGLFQIKTAGTKEETLVGYGKVTADKPISGTLVFLEEDSVDGEIESQAGVEATSVVQSFAVTDFRGGSSTGLAIVNSENTDTEISLTEFDPSGNQLDQSSFVLGPFQHRAFFFFEVLTNVPEGLVVGSVTVGSSNAKVAAIALKVDKGDEEDEMTITPIIQTN